MIGWLIDLLGRLWSFRVFRIFDPCVDYVFNQLNPLFQAFYITLLTVSVWLFYTTGYSILPPDSYHRIGIPVVVCSAYVTFWLACSTDPGYINGKNVNDYMRLFSYDYLLFHPRDCSTCKLPKPARSKHCSVCDRCVAGFDHHCPWINTCVGYRNHRWFLLFLFSVSLLSGYGAWLIYTLLAGEIDKRDLLNMQYTDQDTGELKTVTVKVAWMVMASEYLNLMALGLFSVMISLLISFFLLHHLWLVAKGESTNESFKRQDLKDSLRLGEEVWIGRVVNQKQKVERYRVQDSKELDKNLYTEGVRGNFRRVLFPKAL